MKLIAVLLAPSTLREDGDPIPEPATIAGCVLFDFAIQCGTAEDLRI